MKNKPNKPNTHSSIGSLKRLNCVLFNYNKERCGPSPSCDFKASASPLKSLKISVVKRPNTKISELAQTGSK